MLFISLLVLLVLFLFIYIVNSIYLVFDHGSVISVACFFLDYEYGLYIACFFTVFELGSCTLWRLPISYVLSSLGRSSLAHNFT